MTRVNLAYVFHILCFLVPTLKQGSQALLRSVNPPVAEPPVAEPPGAMAVADVPVDELSFAARRQVDAENVRMLARLYAEL